MTNTAVYDTWTYYTLFLVVASIIRITKNQSFMVHAIRDLASNFFLEITTKFSAPANIILFTPHLLNQWSVQLAPPQRNFEFFYYSRIYGYFQAWIKNLRIFKFFQKINFLYGVLSARLASTSTIEKIQIKKNQTQHILRLFYGSDVH